MAGSKVNTLAEATSISLVREEVPTAGGAKEAGKTDGGGEPSRLGDKLRERIAAERWCNVLLGGQDRGLLEP